MKNLRNALALHTARSTSGPSVGKRFLVPTTAEVRRDCPWCPLAPTSLSQVFSATNLASLRSHTAASSLWGRTVAPLAAAGTVLLISSLQQ